MKHEPSQPGTTEPGGYPADRQNPDDWARFLARYLDNRATNAVHNGIGLVALHIADAIKDASGIGAMQPMPEPTTVPLYAVRRNQDGHAEAIERDGYTVLLLAIGALRNEEEAERIVEVLNGR